MQRADSPRVCALIPAYNAADTLAPVIRGVKKCVDTVIVVDDGSADNTLEVARAEGAETLRHDVNKGKGEALKLGFDQASKSGFDVVVTLDADGQHDPREIPRLIEAYCASDPGTVVLGSRVRQMPEMRRVRAISNRVGTALISWLAGSRIEDSQTGYRVVSVDAWKRAGVRGSRFDAEAEFLVRASRLGYEIRHVPVKSGAIDGTPTSHYRNIRDTISIARGALSAWLRSTWQRAGSANGLEQERHGQED